MLLPIITTCQGGDRRKALCEEALETITIPLYNPRLVSNVEETLKKYHKCRCVLMKDRTPEVSLDVINSYSELNHLLAIQKHIRSWAEGDYLLHFPLYRISDKTISCDTNMWPKAVRECVRKDGHTLIKASRPGGILLGVIQSILDPCLLGCGASVINVHAYPEKTEILLLSPDNYVDYVIEVVTKDMQIDEVSDERCPPGVEIETMDYWR